MKILWFTNTSSLYKTDNNPYHGGGWIKSLEQLIAESPDVELGISFLHVTDDEKQKNGKVTYYPILSKKKKAVSKLIKNWSCKIESEEYIDKLLNVIKDFEPDLIHIFGTEGPFALIQSLTKTPTVIHMQGLILPYSNAFYPPGISDFDILFETTFFKKNILGNSFLFDRRRFKRQAIREGEYFKNAKYLMGRTAWDRSISKQLAPQAEYFHINEVLRPIFYDTRKWNSQTRNKLIIFSTISDTIYKGFDIVLKTAKLLKEYILLPFEWQIAGLNERDKVVRFFEHKFNINHKDCNINILGVKASNDLITMMKEADIFVHPSYIDNSPNSLCEAQLLGIPTIACNVGGISSLIENGINGLLVPANDPYSLAITIRELFYDKARAINLGEKARETALVRHDRGKIAASVLNSYKTIIN